MRFEEQYEDVLQNIEFGIVRVYQEHPEMADWDALTALESLIRAYSAEAQGKPVPPRALTGSSGEVAESVKAMCEWRLGRNSLADEGGRALVDEGGRPIELAPKTLDEIVACLKRIRRSIERWNRQGGRQGYLKFVSHFVR
jgi:hypothetical protein